MLKSGRCHVFVATPTFNRDNRSTTTRRPTETTFHKEAKRLTAKVSQVSQRVTRNTRSRMVGALEIVVAAEEQIDTAKLAFWESWRIK